MKPVAFDYERPSSIDEALSLLTRHGWDAKVIAGGQSLMPMLNFRLARPSVLIDLSGLSGELAFIRDDGDAVVTGALTRHRELEQSSVVAAALPLLAGAVPLIGHVAIRNAGTVGGSLAHADPAAELPAVALAHEAVFELVGPAGRREVKASEFFVGLFTTALQPDELLVAIRWPRLPAGTRSAVLEVARRHGDFALAGVACALTPGPDGTVAMARIVAFGVDQVPVRSQAAELALIGGPLDDAAVSRAVAALRATIQPDDDLHASAQQRRHLAGVLAERVLRQAWQQSDGGGEHGPQR